MSRSTSEAVDGRTIRWAGQRERRRAEFVEAALHTIAECGPATSIEQIAAQVGVTRTKLYRYFDGAADLHREVARRAAAMLITELEPVWKPSGSPLEMVSIGVGAHIRWLTTHTNLYLYLACHLLTDEADAPDAITYIRATVGALLAQLLADYLNAFGIDPRPAEPLGFGIVGFVDSAARQWLQQRGAYSQEELIGQLAEWVWLLLDTTLKAGGVHLDPHEPLAKPEEIAAARA
ncbi:TetR/AcrR family transcriptional regulator [Mycobacterium kyorinense]|uniref:TetR/AcrR family transcriptional regulator n=2 Tax=Mycobacterium kyorinense TaxID=487514 RepID=UPI0005F05CF9|nr:TetR/AcrR family transcriptional regulator [Mycobacterium kyorinense]